MRPAAGRKYQAARDVRTSKFHREPERRDIILGASGLIGVLHHRPGDRAHDAIKARVARRLRRADLLRRSMVEQRDRVRVVKPGAAL